MTNGDSWSVAGVGGEQRAMVQCSTKGCEGMCPRARARRGWDGEEVLAKCFVCGTRFLPNQGKVVLVEKQSKGKGKGKGETKCASKVDVQIQSKLEAKNKLLEAKIKELTTQAVKADAAKEKEASHKSGMEVDSGDTEAGKEVTRLQGDIQELKKVPESIRSFIEGGYQAKLDQLEGQLDSARKQVREANPTEQQLEETKGFQKRAAKRTDKAKAEFAEQELQLKALQEAMEAKRIEVAKLEDENQKALQQVADLVAKFAKESFPEQLQPHPVQGTPVVVPNGYVALAFAQEAWDKREAEFASQLQAVVAEAQAENGSEAGDADQELEEDSNWGKVEKGSRRALITKAKISHRKALATKLSHIGKSRTVSESPFTKSR